MNNTKLKKCTIILFISLILFSTINPVFGAINEAYNKNSPVSDDNIDTKVKDSVIVDALASFVNAIASMVENLVGKAFQGLTGQNNFPWADRILFNAIPLLDINIFNPADASLFKTKADPEKNIQAGYTPLANVVRNTYFTIMTIAVAFLVVVVGIAATKLALTSLATEKAKYKEAITKWMLSIVLLFLMHNVISFIFWTNEKIVEVASNIVKGQIDQANIDLLNEAINIDNAKALKNFLEANDSLTSFSEEDKNFVKENAEIAYELLTSESYVKSALSKAFGDASHSFRNGWRQFWTANGSDSITILKNDIKLIKEGKSTYVVVTYGEQSTPNGMNKTIETNVDFSIDDIRNSIGMSDEEIVNSKGYIYYSKNTMMAISNKVSSNKTYYYKNYYAKAIVNIYDRIHKENNASESDSNQVDLMATLGQYFKESAYVIPFDEDTGEMTGWHRSKLTVQGALLYAIFVFQSIFYFFAYIKRFFYIVVLVIMAPAIVVMDFLRKALV